MGRIVVTEFMSLDGVVEAPGGGEGFVHDGWSFEFDRGEEGNRFKLEETMGSEALLLGRKTYEGFAAAWPSRSHPAWRIIERTCPMIVAACMVWPMMSPTVTASAGAPGPAPEGSTASYQSPPTRSRASAGT